MSEQANRKNWLDRQLVQVGGFIDADSAKAVSEPNRFATELSLTSWLAHQEELRKAMAEINSLCLLNDCELAPL